MPEVNSGTTSLNLLRKNTSRKSRNYRSLCKYWFESKMAWNGNLDTKDQDYRHGSEDFSGSSYPYHLPLLKELECDWDFGELVKCLRNGVELSNVPRRPVTVVVRRVGQKEVDVRQLPPLLASLWALCDGNKTVQDIVELLALRNFGPEGVSPVKACFFGLKTLADDGLIGISSSRREAA